jgi:hypothetical protein
MARAGLQAATVLLHVYGRAHEEEHDGWARKSCREMVKMVEELVEEEELVQGLCERASRDTEGVER